MAAVTAAAATSVHGCMMAAITAAAHGDIVSSLASQAGARRARFLCRHCTTASTINATPSASLMITTTVDGTVRKRTGLPLVISSRYGAGSVQERYGYEGGGHDIAKLGVIFAGRLTGLKARIKLMVALAYTTEDKVLRAIFKESD